MALPTEKKRPDWLTDEVVAEMFAALKRCDSPYTPEDIDDIPLDGKIDYDRLDAYNAQIALKKYGFIE